MKRFFRSIIHRYSHKGGEIQIAERHAFSAERRACWILVVTRLNDAAASQTVASRPGWYRVHDPTRIYQRSGFRQSDIRCRGLHGGRPGIWVRLTLPAGSASYTGAANFRVQGTTT